ncbi:MAG TPA: alpha/beta hydrolase, partial [Mycobacterium sp.]|nr:alpha/beta hydrolase [Mycobacterium sp.]
MGGTPETLYARDGDLYLAYQVVGDSGPDLLFVPMAIWPIDLIWDDPTVARHLRKLASFSRLILADILGAGSSDVVRRENAAIQSWTDGLLAVLDAAGSERASVFGMGGSALPVTLLAASYPDRVRSLVMWSPLARYLRAADHPVGLPEPSIVKFMDAFEAGVGTGATLDRLAPSWAGDDAKRRWWARCERLEGTPGYFRWMLDLYLNSDLRPAA